MSRIQNFANAASAIRTMDATTSPFKLFFNAANEVDKLRWVCIAPYGDWPNGQGLQRFQKEDAQTIVNEFQSLLNTPQRAIGAPWYIGHPDHPAFNEKYRDTKAYGRIKKLEARQDGLYAGVKFGSDGEKLISDEAFHGHSVNWYLKEQDDKKAWRPFKLKSVGFTNEPNIPVPTLTTANEAAKVCTVEFLKGNELRYAHIAKLRDAQLMANGGPGSGRRKSGVSQDEERHEEDEQHHECPMCGGPGVPIGSLGQRAYHRCRNCGADFSSAKEDDPSTGVVKHPIARVAGKGESGHTHKGEQDLSEGESYYNEERYRRLAVFRLIGNEGTSDGALKGWESRHGAAGAASAIADLATKRADEKEASMTDEDAASVASAHHEAAQAHEAAAGKWAAVNNDDGKMAYHSGMAQAHTAKSMAHDLGLKIHGAYDKVKGFAEHMAESKAASLTSEAMDGLTPHSYADI